VPIVLKSGSLNLLEPSGPLQVCNGIALPLPYNFTHAIFKETNNKKDENNIFEIKAKF
jgi:hypothetical protein